MAASLFPTEVGASGWTHIRELLDHVQLAQPAWDAVEARIGDLSTACGCGPSSRSQWSMPPFGMQGSSHLRAPEWQLERRRPSQRRLLP